MTWVAPWAFVGLVAVAAPILVHWLARQRAERLRFPTIQFLMPTAPLSVRRHRLKDLPLLLVRVAMVVSAVAALAQPVWVRPAAPAARQARAIVVDTSASLRRVLADGRVGLDVAREAAAALAAGAEPMAQPAKVIATEDVAAGVGKAAVWLAGQDSPRELIVVSDFQVGGLVLSDFAAVPTDAGVRLVPVGVSGPVPAAPAQARGRLRVFVGPEGAREAAASEAAARAVELGGDLPQLPKFASAKFASELDSGGAPVDVALVFASSPDYQRLRSEAKPVETPELFALVADIRGTSGKELGGDLLQIASELLSGVISGVAIFTDVGPGSIEAATLMGAILRATAPPALSPAEREPDTLAPATLDAWQREPVPAAPGRGSGRSDGRWLWALALLLFGVEAWIRRPPMAQRTEVAHADAA